MSYAKAIQRALDEQRAVDTIRLQAPVTGGVLRINGRTYLIAGAGSS